MSAAQVFFTVDGKPVGQGNHRQNRYGATYETSKGHKEWRRAVKEAAVRCQQTVGSDGIGGTPWTPMPGPIHVSITFHIPRPAGHYGTGRNAHTVKATAPKWPTHGQHPDLDKAVRAVLDACTDAACWDDDKQVVTLDVTKRWAVDRPGADLTITDLHALAELVHDAIPAGAL